VRRTCYTHEMRRYCYTRYARAANAINKLTRADRRQRTHVKNTLLNGPTGIAINTNYTRTHTNARAPARTHTHTNTRGRVFTPTADVRVSDTRRVYTERAYCAVGCETKHFDKSQTKRNGSGRARWFASYRRIENKSRIYGARPTVV